MYILTGDNKCSILFRVSKISWHDILGGKKLSLENQTEEIVKNVRLISRMIHMKRHEIAQCHNLTLDQFHTLIYLNNIESPPTIGEMATEIRKAQNTISERVSRLEEKDLVERIKDKHDRRISRVALTKKGTELISSINYQAGNEFVRKALINIDEKTVENMVYGLEQLAKSLDIK